MLKEYTGTESRRDTTLSALRLLGMIDDRGGSGRGRQYRLTVFGQQVLNLLDQPSTKP